MKIDKAIKHAEELAEENQRVVDTGIVYDDVTIDMLYCDDTEVIEEHLANYQMYADEYRQLAEWLKDYKRLLEQKPCEDDISRQAVLEMAYDMSEIDGEHFTKPWMVVDVEDIQKLPPVNPTSNISIQITEREKFGRFN